MGAAPVETATAEPAPVNAAGPHTMRSLAETFIPYEPEPSDEPRLTPGVHLVDLSRVRQLVDVPPATNPDATEPMLLASHLKLREPRFGACVPFDQGALEVLGWEPGAATGAALQFWEECGVYYVGDNVLVRGAPAVFDPLPEQLLDLGGGLYTDLDAADRVQLTGGPRPLHGSFMPTRIATNGPDVLFTLDTPTARAWLEGDQAQALGSDDRFMQVVDELDRHEVFAATIRVAHDPFYDLRESRDRNRDRLMQDRDQYLLIRESCDRVAIGFSAEPAGSFTTHVVYQFPDEQTAAAALPSVQETWSSGWARAWVPIGDVIDAVHSVVPKGDLVVVSVDAGDYAREMTGHVGVSAPLVCDGDA